MLALGVVPVGVGDFLGGYDWRERPWAQEALGGAEPEVVGGQEINFEAVAAQRPDLIIAINAGLKKADYERLSKIAPTVAQSGDYIDFGMPWDEQTLLVGRALGREDAGASRSSPTSRRSSRRSARSTRSSRARRAILAYGGPDGYGAYATQDTRSRFLTDLGFELPAADRRARRRVVLRRVQPGAVPADGPGRSSSCTARRTTSLDNPVFKRLDAVTRGPRGLPRPAPTSSRARSASRAR